MRVLDNVLKSIKKNFSRMQNLTSKPGKKFRECKSRNQTFKRTHNI